MIVKVKIPARRESSIGTRFVRLVRECAPSSLVWKLASPGRRDVPDYVVVLPMARVAFIEFKKPRQQPTERQRRMIASLNGLGHVAIWSDDADVAVAELIERFGSL